MNNERVHTCGHEVPEDTIKLFIQLIIITNVNKKWGRSCFPCWNICTGQRTHNVTIYFIKYMVKNETTNMCRNRRVILT